MKKNQSNTAFSQNIDIYDTNWSDWHDMKIHGPASRWLRSLITDLSSFISEDIRTGLDLGCGEGTQTAMIASLFPKVQFIGADFSSSSIKVASEIYSSNNLKFIYDKQSECLNFRYDLICCFEVLEHVDDWENLLEKIAHSTIKYLFISTPTGRMREVEKEVGHVRNFKHGEIESFLEKLNFSPVKTYYAGFPFFSPIYRDINENINIAHSNFARGRYSAKQKIISNILYFLFRNLSLKTFGDQFVGLFEKK